MSVQKERLEEANRALASYVNTNSLSSYVGKFSENEPKFGFGRKFWAY